MSIDNGVGRDHRNSAVFHVNQPLIVRSVESIWGGGIHMNRYIALDRSHMR